MPADVDERRLRDDHYRAKYNEESLRLIVLPTEQCNFRCVYCYESFTRGTMRPEIRDGLRKFVASQTRMKRLDLQWFGGEPLVAADVVIELTQHFAEHCRSRGLAFTSGITTNGSLLTEDIARQLIPAGVRFFQITLDGLRDDHDKTRVLETGGGTFDTIMVNLRMLKGLEYPFVVGLRHNFSPDNMGRLEAFIELLRREFGDDPRFTLMFEAVQQWGGPNDVLLNVCDATAVVQRKAKAMGLAVEAGFRNTFLLDRLAPAGVVCYAADPRCFVIGSDGAIYKCTVELDSHQRNVVGTLHEDGTVELDWRKMALWTETNGMQPGEKCDTCFFSPQCFGALCPKSWLDTGGVTCPPEKTAIREILPLVFRQSHLPPPPDVTVAVD